MPYYISNQNADCSGWAVEKEDGEVIGCHTNKQEAIDQMVAVSIAEDMEPGGERKYKKKFKRVADGPLAVISDIDGILIIDGQREDKAYDYLDEMEDTEIVLITARLESSRGETIEELADLEIEYNQIFFRPNEDVDVSQYKYAVAEQLLETYNVIIGLDDRSDVRDAYRNLGITALGLDEIPETIERTISKRAEPDALKVGDFVSWNSSGGRARGQITRIVRDGQINVPDTDFTITGTEDDPAALIRIWRDNESTDTLVGHKFSTLTKIDDLGEDRQVNLKPPAYMRAAARRGLELHQQGFSGDGLLPRTVREAREMAAGRVTEDKWIRIAAWIARHLVDLDAPRNSKTDDPNYPGAGLVAHLLWGSGPSKSAAERALNYAEGVVERIRSEESRSRWSSVDIQLKKEKDQPVTKVERRIKNDIDFEIRLDNADVDGMQFSGYAAVFNRDSEPLPFTERILPGAFSKTLRSRNEIKLFKNHNMDEVLASTRSKTLRLKEDGSGLLAEAVLPDTTAGRDLAVLMKRGDVHSMSFGFSVPDGGDNWNARGTVRELREVRLHEVSIVTGFPAYSATTASVRSLEVLATRTEVDVDKIADVLVKLESGETLPDDEADLLIEVVGKLKENKEEVQKDISNLNLKRKELDLLFKAV